jgi:hypothetical protein
MDIAAGISKKKKIPNKSDIVGTDSNLSNDDDDDGKPKRFKNLDFEIKKPGSHAKVWKFMAVSFTSFKRKIKIPVVFFKGRRVAQVENDA